MTINEIYFKTAFCCMACDQDIAQEEINLLKRIATASDLFDGISIEPTANKYIAQINDSGAVFLSKFLSEIEEQYFTLEEQLNIIDIALQTIKADHKILGEEAYFFKQIRDRLSISDSEILEVFSEHVDLTELLLPNIEPYIESNWTVRFEPLDFSVEMYT